MAKKRPDTFDTIRAKYDTWSKEENRRTPRPGTYTPPDQNPGDGGMSRVVITTIGVGLGLVILLLAAFSFYTAAAWAEVPRSGAANGWLAVGVFLTISGLGCAIGTWHHNFRVLTRPPEHHH